MTWSALDLANHSHSKVYPCACSAGLESFGGRGCFRLLVQDYGTTKKQIPPRYLKHWVAVQLKLVCWISNDIKWGFRSFWSVYSNSYSSWILIGHFSRVPKTLTSKMRPSVQPFLWEWVLVAWEWKIISISKAEHLTSFWYSGWGELARKRPIWVNEKLYYLYKKRVVSSR